MSLPRSVLARLGRLAIAVWREAAWITGAVVAVLVSAARPRFWRRTVRAVLVEQLFSMGVRSTGFIILLGVAVGMGMVFQGLLWLGLAGQTEFIGRFLVIGLVRETAPVLIGIIIIGRSGTAIIAELGTMSATGQVRALDAQGVDPFSYLVVPRAVAMAISAYCLCVFFLAVAVASGYLFAALVGLETMGPAVLVTTLLQEVGWREAMALPLQTIMPGLSTAVICCARGLARGGTRAERPRAVPAGFVQSVTALVLTVVAVTLCCY